MLVSKNLKSKVNPNITTKITCYVYLLGALGDLEAKA
jgi:hypothetical protein